MFNINHVTISVSNLEKSLDFYKKFGFDFVKEYHDSAVDIVLMRLKNVILEIFHYNENLPLPEHSKELSVDLKTLGNKHFGLGVENISKAEKFVRQSGICEGEINIVQGRLGKPYFFIKDPDGILIEIIEE